MNPAIKRIKADIRELQTDPSDMYYALPLEVLLAKHPVLCLLFELTLHLSQDNMFDWHFVIRGPADTDFAGGLYHGRITLPSDYPFKAPNIMLLTVRGGAAMDSPGRLLTARACVSRMADLKCGKKSA
jgi:ubiquitin-conjugating enzyme E2 J1